MKFISGCYTDIGTRKSTNQDSMLLLHADTPQGEAVFASVCDGMGGLAKGEVASSDTIYALSNWFRTKFPELIAGGALNAEELRRQWMELMRDQDSRISRYGAQNGWKLGTTLVCLLIYNGQYYVGNIGDSRAYLLSDQIYQITHDHTVVQRKLDQGLITFEQAMSDPQRSVLLQCIGASDYVEPDFFGGAVYPDQSFLLCCDGFRHVIAPGELFESLRAQRCPSTEAIEQNLYQLTELNKNRGETDNISAIVIRTCP